MMILQKCLHIWGSMDPLSLFALVILFFSEFRKMSHLAPIVMSVMSHYTIAIG